ncbi:hypothetical protein CS0771_49200 [Catellatospora sp. IY07-71]|uniref:hypothetical protein n=1 Tax=Catellatospora sp. IY07-71 TaxID=2728827 RepID=UPI001BB38465|nr:hypothetical protein [Catellatospora sp. IY07-71]BCJ75376.1 hypothetical protein CS0771_49200 [Catellatospora sp. IY07-71]
MSDTTAEIARIDAQATAARAALSQTLAQLTERADVAGRIKARTAEVTGQALSAIQDRRNQHLAWLAAGVLVVAAMTFLVRRRS